MEFAPVGQAVFPESGVPPGATGCGVGPVCGTVMSVQTIWVIVSTEKKPVPSPFTTYCPSSRKMASHVLPLNGVGRGHRVAGKIFRTIRAEHTHAQDILPGRLGDTARIAGRVCAKAFHRRYAERIVAFHRRRVVVIVRFTQSRQTGYSNRNDCGKYR